MSTDGAFKGWGDGIIRCTKCGIEHTGSVGSGAPDAVARLGMPECNAGDHDFRKSIGDERLLAYLWNNKHLTPFEMVQIRIEVQAPIFVFREWHRHRTQSYNELSARYTPLPANNYVPSVERLMQPGGVNRQATGLRPLRREDAQSFREILIGAYEGTQRVYEEALHTGVPKELARLIVPVGRYSRMQASANLRNWLHFLELRMDSHAQWEIRQYANALGSILEMYLPRTWALFQSDREAREQ